MGAEVIQADYEQLNTITNYFQHQADLIHQVSQRVNRDMDALQGGGWQGEGIQAFTKELEGEVLPSIDRLRQAMVEAQKTTLDISTTMRAAEEEAARLFCDEDHGAWRRFRYGRCWQSRNRYSRWPRGCG